MKRLSIILSSTAIAAVSVLYVITFAYKHAKEKVMASPTESYIAMGSDMIVYVNLDSLVHGYDMYFDMRSEFENKVQSKERDFGSRRKKLESEIRVFQEKIEQGLVTRSQAQQLQETLQRKEQELAQLGQQMQAELAEEEAVILRRIQNNIQKYIKEYNANKGYRLILSNTSGSVVLYGEPALNITHDVLVGLNSSYSRTK
jgi:outer membrane protein